MKRMKAWVKDMVSKPKDEREAFWTFVYQALHNHSYENYELRQEIKRLKEKLKKLK